MGGLPQRFFETRARSRGLHLHASERSINADRDGAAAPKRAPRASSPWRAGLASTPALVMVQRPSQSKRHYLCMSMIGCSVLGGEGRAGETEIVWDRHAVRRFGGYMGQCRGKPGK